VGEIFEPTRLKRYLLPDELDMAFALVRAPWSASRWKEAIDVDRHASPGSVAAPSWTQSNHDTVRHVTRLGGGIIGRARARAALLLLLGLPGQVFLYQGEELGLEEVLVPPKKRQDPVWIRSKGKQVGRDGCRVPLPWHRGRRHAGFSKATPWLPMPSGWDNLAVDVQEGSAGSMLVFYKQVIALRRRLRDMLPNRLRWRPAPHGALLYNRGRLVVAVNFLARPVVIPLQGRLLVASSPRTRLSGGKLSLAANSGAWLDRQVELEPG
jgi:alpha-glucosidase